MKPFVPDKYDRLVSEIVRYRDRWKCQRCGRSFSPDDSGSRMGLDCSHYIGRGNHAVRYDLTNLVALCRPCHGWFEMHKTTYYREFMIARLGESDFEALEETSRKDDVWDYGRKEFMYSAHKKTLDSLREDYALLP